jgi:siroheme synthase-like protein
MKVYPIMLRLSGRRAVVIGGGPVGVRKARSLAAAGAQVVLVADSLAEAAPEGVHVVGRRYDPADLRGAALVFACTGERATNARIAADARRVGAWVNCADQPDDCDFLAPAVAREGDVVVAVGTGATAPALCAPLRDRLREALPPGVGEFAAALAALRPALRARVDDPHCRGRILRRLAGEEGYQTFRHRGPDALRRMLNELIINEAPS